MFPQGIGFIEKGNNFLGNRFHREREQLPREKGRNYFRGKGTKLLWRAT
jgi:hypothetical protein